MAKLFRRTRTPGAGRRCDVEALCAEDGIEVFDSRMTDPGYTACLCRDPLGTGGGIVLAPGQAVGRRRFSICHELAHYHIPTHRRSGDSGMSCGDREMRADADDVEGEANDFASELLMPGQQFRIDVAARDISVATARELASDRFYDVSVTAAALRMIQLARDPCALVVTSRGVVDWAARSEALRLPGLQRGSVVGSTTLAGSSTDLAEGEPRPIQVDVAAWFDPQFPVRGKLLESTHVIRRTNQVASLLWLVDEDDAD